MLRILLLACVCCLADGLLSGVAVSRSCVLPAPPRSAVGMKVFDWKRRGAEAPELQTIDLSNLKAAPGSAKSKTRKGRGISAGQGASCGFGYRGQKSRSGRSTRPGFEGGQIPLYRRLPKFVGRPVGMSHFKKEYELIKISMLNAMSEGSEVDYAALMDVRAASKTKYKLQKVVSSGEPLSVKGLKVKAHAFTKSARVAIEEQGGSCVLLSPTTNKPIGSGEELAEVA